MMDASLGDLRIANQHVFQQKEKRERKQLFSSNNIVYNRIKQEEQPIFCKTNNKRKKTAKQKKIQANAPIS